MAGRRSLGGACDDQQLRAPVTTKAESGAWKSTIRMCLSEEFNIELSVIVISFVKQS